METKNLSDKIIEFVVFIQQKFESGNNIPVERITLKREEVEKYFDLQEREL